jgi:hypothetical protein
MTTASGKTTGNGKAKRRSGRNAQKERKWRRLIGEQRRSGRTVRAFCKARGVSESLFYYWRGRIEGVGGEKSEKSTKSETSKRSGRKTKRGKAGAVLAPVVIVDGPDESAGERAASIEIVFGEGTTVRVPVSSTREHLTLVLSVLEETRC